MSKLIKRNQLGGIAEAVDSSLNKLGTWGKLGVQMLDPTGITGWKDFGDSLKAFQKEGSLMKAGELGLSALGAIPMFGAFPRLLGLTKKVDKVSDAAKLIKKTKDLPKGIDLNLYKQLLDPKVDPTSVIKSLDVEELAKLKSCVESSASQYLKVAGTNAASPELVAKTKHYEDLLTLMDKEITSKGLDNLYSEADDILVTGDHVFDVLAGGTPSWPTPVKGSSKAKRAAKEAAALQAKKDFVADNPIIYFK